MNADPGRPTAGLAGQILSQHSDRRSSPLPPWPARVRSTGCFVERPTAGIPVPAGSVLGRSDDRAWMIQDWIEGRPDNLAQLNGDDPLIRLGVYHPADQPKLKDAFEALAAGSFSVALQHGDPSPGNLIVPSRGGPVLIDWGCAVVDVMPLQPINHLRLSRCTRGAPSEDGLRAFAGGLAVRWAECLAMETVLNRWLVLKMVDLVRWALDRCPGRVVETGDIARRVTGAFLAGRRPVNAGAG